MSTGYWRTARASHSANDRYKRLPVLLALVTVGFFKPTRQQYENKDSRANLMFD